MRALPRWPALALLAALAAGGCAPHTLYRTDYTACASPAPEAECVEHALQEYRDAGAPDRAYLLGFIEFDDQGQLFDRRQMRAVIDGVYDELAPDGQDLLVVVFVHGWKHSAAPGDDNIRTFRATLARLSALESEVSRLTGDRPRKVVGVYLGWRGASITLPLLKELTFWDRKNTAHKVGQGGVTEVLARLELAKLTKDAVAGPGGSRTRLVVVGHSFGGAVVYSALGQIPEGRFVRTVGPPGRVGDAEGFGNLVVLINPAFEALRFAPLSDMSTERGTYFDTQLPVLAVLTSEADDATRVAFPLGRWFSTLFEKERVAERPNGVTGEMERINQKAANVTAVGHFEPYRTHYLRAAGEAAVEAAPAASAVELFLRASDSWENDAPGSEIPFEGSVLTRTETSAGRNPYLVVRVDKELIRDHNHIDDPRVASFLRQLILMASQSADPVERRTKRARAMEERTR
ncbi:MAG: hypothetical protein Kow0092_18400 [Deferrisomatales bacterium]